MNLIDKIWYGKSMLSLALAPLGWLYCGLASLRRWCYEIGVFERERQPVPVIVVGNITVGGTGKTPLVVWLVQFLRAQGYTPGIVSRGYGGLARRWPQQVRGDSDPRAVGDEAILLARRCQCPMAVDPDRADAVEALLKYTKVDIVISDDGLQHYALMRDIEIAVVDGVRRFGNGRCLPAGPLREPRSRLATVDFVIVNGLGGQGEHAMQLHVHEARQVGGSACRPLAEFKDTPVHAVAGIGHPERFFSELRKHGLTVIEHPFPDHHPFRPQDIAFDDDHPILMTEKDAVKCERFAHAGFWYVPVETQPDKTFSQLLLERLRTPHGQKTA